MGNGQGRGRGRGRGRGKTETEMESSQPVHCSLQSTNTKWRECSQAKATTAGDWSYRQTALEVCNDLLLAQGRNSPIVAST
jgi:hypothetical protein